MKSNVIFLLLVASLLESRVVAQPQLWDVYSTSNQPFVNVNIERYQSDTLYMKFMNQSFAIHQDSIQYLVQRKSSKVGIGLLIGAVAGGILGSQMSKGESSDELFSSWKMNLSGINIIAGIAVGGVIGGAVGAAAGADTKYRLDKLEPEEKRKLLTKLFPGQLIE